MKFREVLEKTYEDSLVLVTFFVEDGTKWLGDNQRKLEKYGMVAPGFSEDEIVVTVNRNKIDEVEQKIIDLGGEIVKMSSAEQKPDNTLTTYRKNPKQNY